MNNYIEYFTNYVKKNYDINNELIIRKYYHSLRVAWLMNTISNKLGLDANDTILAFKMGLCHDLGRFYEVVKNKRFNNLIFDHAAYSNKILYNDFFVNYMDITDHILFRKAIYYHNKKELGYDLTKKEALFANMLRDADKIDLLGIRSQGKELAFNKMPTALVWQNYFNDLQIDIKNIHNSSDSVILYLSFIKDLTFNVSFDIFSNEHYLESLLKIINVNEKNNDLFNELINKLKERRGKVYVR